MTYVKKIEALKNRYEGRIKAILTGIADDCRLSGLQVDSEISHWCDEYHWWFFNINKDGHLAVEVKISISEQRAFEDFNESNEDNETGGIGFMIDIMGVNGEVIGRICPYNYTPEVWVNIDDADGITARFDEFENLCDPDSAVELIQENLPKIVHIE